MSDLEAIWTPTTAKVRKSVEQLLQERGQINEEQLAQARVVQAQTYSYYGFDNRATADSVRANRDWSVGVCNLDPDDPASPEHFATLVRDYGFRGICLFAGLGGEDRDELQERRHVRPRGRTR